MKHYIYILWSNTLQKYYIGETQNYKQRIIKHNSSTNTSFSSKAQDWVFKAVFELEGDRIAAVKIERYIKKQKSRIFLEKIINPDSDLTGELKNLKRIQL